MTCKSKKSFVKETSQTSSKKLHISKPPKTRNCVICNCNLCKDKKVDSRTRESYMARKELLRNESTDMATGGEASQISVQD